MLRSGGWAKFACIRSFLPLLVSGVGASCSVDFLFRASRLALSGNLRVYYAWPNVWPVPDGDPSALECSCNLEEAMGCTSPRAPWQTLSAISPTPLGFACYLVSCATHLCGHLHNCGSEARRTTTHNGVRGHLFHCGTLAPDALGSLTQPIMNLRPLPCWFVMQLPGFSVFMG